MRSAVPATKRLAIVLHWLAHVPSFSQLATLYYLGKSTIISIVHQGIDIRERLTPNAILFPMASELKQVMVDFEALCGLPNCAGALDGIFIPIKKPEMFGDTYFCYKRFCAILLLGCVDAQGIFTYVTVGRPGLVGDSYAFPHSLLYEKINGGEWLAHYSTLIGRVHVKPFLVADAAFPMDSPFAKCYDDTGPMPNYEHSFSCSLIQTRQVVEQASCGAGFWSVERQMAYNGWPMYSQQHSACEEGCNGVLSLHNICERHQCLLNRVGCQMKLLMFTQHQPIYKQLQ